MRSKYGNTKVTVDGIKFDSKREATRYCELKLIEKAGELSNLKLQVRFLLQDGFSKDGVKHRPIVYVADFVYLDKNGKTIVEDTKGKQTDVYKLKKKLFEARYPGLTIKEI